MRFYLSAILILLLHVIAFGQKQETAKSIPFLIVEVENGKSLKLSAPDLLRLPRHEVKAKDHDGKDASFSGVELREILLLAGAKLSKELRGPQLGAFVVVEAADGYKAVFGITELDSGFTDRIVIIADTRDAKPLPDTNGPWQIIVPDEKKHGRWVRQVTAIRVRFAK